MQRVYDAPHLCCGCAACATKCPTKAIEMQMTDGFAYPKIQTERCVDCGVCRDVCPMVKATHNENSGVLAYAARHMQDTVRQNSSSGGAFTALSDVFLENGGAVCGAVFGKDMQVQHTVTTDVNVRNAMRGAKYVQSDMRAAYPQLKQLLEDGKEVLFVGTPCEVAGVKSTFSKYAQHLFTVDLICHGVPSPDIWWQYIDLLTQTYGKAVTGYTFRDKQNGWHDYRAVVTFEDGTRAADTPLINSYLDIFRYDLTLRPACAQCPFACTARQGDITLGDFWGIEDVVPEWNDDKGVSAVLVNTEKGKQLLPYLQRSMQMIPCTMEQIARRQPNLSRPSVPSVKQTAFLQDAQRLSFTQLLKKYTRWGIQRRLVEKVKRYIGR